MKSESSSAGQKLWKRRAKNALGNQKPISTFPQLQQQQASYLTIVITFCKILKPASLRSDD